MLKIGVTGGIGTGKSTVCAVFSLLSIPVFDADREAKRLMHDDPELVGKIKSEFGTFVYDSQDRLDRKALASLVFADSYKLERLNSFVHPAVFQAYHTWASGKASYPYVVKEAALMYESGADRMNDFNIVVAAPEKLRIERVLKRDGLAREQVLERIRKQLPEDEKRAKADFIIYNDEQQLVIPQVLKLHQFFLSQRA